MESITDDHNKAMAVTTAPSYHVPVLLHESIDGLNVHDGGVYVDVTFGGALALRDISTALTRMPTLPGDFRRKTTALCPGTLHSSSATSAT